MQFSHWAELFFQSKYFFNRFFLCEAEIISFNTSNFVCFQACRHLYVAHDAIRLNWKSHHLEKCLNNANFRVNLIPLNDSCFRKDFIRVYPFNYLFIRLTANNIAFIIRFGLHYIWYCSVWFSVLFLSCYRSLIWHDYSIENTK